MSVNAEAVVSLRASEVESLESKLANRTASVGIIGLGYVGLPLSLLFTEAGFPVTGFDIDVSKVEKLSRSESYIYRVPSSEIKLARMRRFSPTTDFSRIADMDAAIICVPTPLNEHREPDLSYITGTAEAIRPYLRPGQLIVLESTTYPGTTEEVLLPILEKNGRGLCAERQHERGARECFYVAFSPSAKIPATTAWRDVIFPK